jgi:hypothetical protein
MLKYGPIKARHDWERVAAYAEIDTEDVLQTAERCYASEQGLYNPWHPWGSPKVMDLKWIGPVLFTKMPDWVGFSGLSTLGYYHGRYYTHTGEVVGEIEMRSGTTLHITGRVANHTTTTEIDGVPAKLVYPPKTNDAY